MSNELREEIEKILLHPGNHAGFITGINDQYPGLNLKVHLTSEMLRNNLNMDMLVKDFIDLITRREAAAYEKGLNENKEFLDSSVRAVSEQLGGYRKGVEAMQEVCKGFIKTKAVGWNDLVEEYDVRLYEGIDAAAKKLLTNNQS